MDLQTVQLTGWLGPGIIQTTDPRGYQTGATHKQDDPPPANPHGPTEPWEPSGLQVRLGPGLQLLSEFAEVDMAQLQNAFMDILDGLRRQLPQIMGELLKNDFTYIDEVYDLATRAAKANLNSEILQASGSIVGAVVSGAGGIAGSGKLGKAGEKSKRAHKAMYEAENKQERARRKIAKATDAQSQLEVNLENTRRRINQIDTRLKQKNKLDPATQQQLNAESTKLHEAESELNAGVLKSESSLKKGHNALSKATKQFRTASEAARESDLKIRDAELLGQVAREVGSLVSATFRIGGANERNMAEELQASQNRSQALMELHNRFAESLRSNWQMNGEDLKKSLNVMATIVSMTSETNKRFYNNI